MAGLGLTFVELIRSRLLATAGFVLVMILSACSDGGDPADGETLVSDGDDGADAQVDSTTEPEAPQADDQRIGGELTGFTVVIPEDWLNVPTDPDMIDAFVEQEDIPNDVAVSMHLVASELRAEWPESNLLAYGGTEDDVDIFLIASCEPDDGSFDGSETGSATVDGIPAARSTASDRDLKKVWLNYRFLAGDEVCWVRFPAPDESWFAQFDDIVATIDVL